MEKEETSRDRIRQQILLETENLKFVQVFFLPIFPGIVITVLITPGGDSAVSAPLLTASIVLFLLLLTARNRVADRIKRLIELL